MNYTTQPANTTLKVLLNITNEMEEIKVKFMTQNERKRTLRISRLLVISHFLHHVFVITSIKETMLY